MVKSTVSAMLISCSFASLQPDHHYVQSIGTGAARSLDCLLGCWLSKRQRYDGEAEQCLVEEMFWCCSS